MRSRQAKGLQQRWLVVVRIWSPEGSWDAAIQGAGIQVKAYQRWPMSCFAMISSRRRRVPPVVPSGSRSVAKNCRCEISSEGAQGAWVNLRKVNTATWSPGNLSLIHI